MKKKNKESIILSVVIIALLTFLAFLQLNDQTSKYDNLDIDSLKLNIFFFAFFAIIIANFCFFQIRNMGARKK